MLLYCISSDFNRDYLRGYDGMDYSQHFKGTEGIGFIGGKDVDGSALTFTGEGVLNDLIVNLPKFIERYEHFDLVF